MSTINADVIQSINEAGIDLSSCWLWSSADIYSQDYLEVYTQPVSIEVVTLAQIRFKTNETTLTIRRSNNPLSTVVFNADVYLNIDPEIDNPSINPIRQQISTGVVGSTAPSATYGTGVITIQDANVNLYDNPIFSGDIKTYHIDSNTFTLIDGSEQYIVADYNNGTPIYRLENDKFAINDSNIVLIRICWRQGNTVHSIDSDCQGSALANKIEAALISTTPYKKSIDGGMSLGETSTPTPRTITISSAIVFAASTPHSVSAFNSSVNKLTFVGHTAGVWNYTDVAVYNNTQYDDGTNLQTVGNNNYAVCWFYRSIGNDIQSFFVLGTNEYPTVAKAQIERPRSDIPILLRDHCMLVGRIIIQKNASSGLVENVSDVSFSSSTPTNHNDLLNIQGGFTGEYYHLSASQFNQLTSGGDTSLHYHSADRNRANHTGTQSWTTISAVPVASTSTSGVLTSANWNTFNNKQDNIPTSATTQYYRGDKTWQTLNTSIVPELTNLYWTQTRFDSALSAKTTTNLTEGTNLYFTNARVKTYADTLYLPISGIDASKIVTGTIDPARIPVLPSQVPQVTTNIPSLSVAQQNTITSGTIVTTSDDGFRYVYSGVGSKTTSASYIVLADITPEWSAISNKPTNVSYWFNDSGYLTAASSLDPSKVVQTSAYRFATDTEKATWNGKQNAGNYVTTDTTQTISATKTFSVSLNLTGSNTAYNTVNGNYASVGALGSYFSDVAINDTILRGAAGTTLRLGINTGGASTVQITGTGTNFTGTLTRAGNTIWDASNLVQANGSTNGWLSSADWSTFNNKQSNLGFTPVQQGGGTGQGTNKLYMGWSGSGLLLQVDATNFGNQWPIAITGSSQDSAKLNGQSASYYATNASLSGYLPLSAGSGNKLTALLYASGGVTVDAGASTFWGLAGYANAIFTGDVSGDAGIKASSGTFRLGVNAGVGTAAIAMTNSVVTVNLPLTGTTSTMGIASMATWTTATAAWFGRSGYNSGALNGFFADGTNSWCGAPTGGAAGLTINGDPKFQATTSQITATLPILGTNATFTGSGSFGTTLGVTGTATVGNLTTGGLVSLNTGSETRHGYQSYVTYSKQILPNSAAAIDAFNQVIIIPSGWVGSITSMPNGVIDGQTILIKNGSTSSVTLPGSNVSGNMKIIPSTVDRWLVWDAGSGFWR